MERNLAAAPHFEVKEPNEFLTNPIRQEEYRRYRQQYRAHFGVLPELDIIHHPAVAVPSSDAFWPSKAATNSGKNILKSFGKMIGSGAKIGAGLMSPGSGFITDGLCGAIEGIGGTLNQHPELMAEFTRRFNALVSPYKSLYALLFDPDILPDLNAIPEGEYIVNGLGYRADRSTQTYWEGTWENGRLVYGLIWQPGGKLCIADMSDEHLWKGVFRKDDLICCGSLNSIGLECEEGLSLELDSNHAFLGPHHQDQLDGMIIVLDTSTGEIIKQEYVMGDPRSGLGGLISRQKAKLDTHKNTINHLFGRFAR